MLKITKQTDYGVMLMTLMARSPADTLHNARDLAAQSHVPQPMVSKILKILSRHDLLASQRGAKGGYHLARAAADINLAQIVGALEGAIAMTDCVEESETSCDIRDFCGVAVNWQRINTAVRVALEAITLEEMMQTSVECRCDGEGALSAKQDDQSMTI